jgi:hypothetical protein
LHRFSICPILQTRECSNVNVTCLNLKNTHAI